MPEFNNSILVADNVDFSGANPPVGQITSDGQLLIGATSGQNIRTGTLTAPLSGFTITNAGGSITFALSDDLSALESLSGTGFGARIAADTWINRSLDAGSSKITITNPDGIAGNQTPDIDPANINFDELGGVTTGTFTPTISGSGTSGSGTYTTQIGNYMQLSAGSGIGRVVFATGQVAWTAHTGTGNMRIAGFPSIFGSNGTFHLGSITYANIVLPSNSVQAYLRGNNAQSIARLQTAQDNGVVRDVAMDSSGEINFSIVYF